jgi:hypothetical protein
MSRSFGAGLSASGCTSLTGVSPVPVGVGAPGSRPQVFGGDPFARAGCRKPVRRLRLPSGEQARGPQHQVKPAASSELQSGSRAAHVTVKAMSIMLVPKRVVGSGGVWGAARVHRGVWNSRGPSRLPLSRQGGSYKPKAKSSAAERESEGTIVPVRAVWHNAVLGKGPCGGCVVDGGKREGMAGLTGPNNPQRRKSVVKARQLRRRLWDVAKGSSAGLFSRVAGFPCEGDVLWVAWEWVVLEDCVMPCLERPLVSRVREIRTHGLNGGLDYRARREAGKE